MQVASVRDGKLIYAVILLLLVIGGVILLNYLSFLNAEDLVMEQLRKQQLRDTEFIAAQMEMHILRVRDELLTLTRFPLVDTLDLNKCSGDMRIVHEKIEGKINSLLRVDANGTIVECSSQDFSDFVGLNIQNKDYFKVPRESNEPFIAPLQRRSTSAYLVITAPLVDTVDYSSNPQLPGDFKGLLMTIIDLEQLYKLYITSFVSEGSTYFVLLRAGKKDIFMKSRDLEISLELKNHLFSIQENSAFILNDVNLGAVLVTASDIVLPLERWRLVLLTPLANTVGSNIHSAQKRHLFGLFMVAISIVSVFLIFLRTHREKEAFQSSLDKARVTLKELGIGIQLEGKTFNQADTSLRPGKIYLVRDDSENSAHELFISSLSKGFAGLGIVRDDPRVLRKKYGLSKTSFIWLSNCSSKEIPCETDIEVLFSLVREFIEKSPRSVVLIDRLDYIVSENSFREVLRAIRNLRDIVMSREAIVILSLDSSLLDDRQIRALEAETVDLYGRELRQKVSLLDLERDILRFINEGNLSNRLVSYKDITSRFGITKPTTRAKIKKLHRLGLVSIEKRGRFKSLRITSAGRRLI